MKKNPKISIGLILYKGEKYLPLSLTSLTSQDNPNIEYLIRDQSPNGEAYEYVKKELPEVFKKVKIEKGENLWHSGGHNALINKMTGEYYFCCSNDMFYPSNFVSQMIKELEKKENKDYGSATCKLMHWDFENDVKTSTLDSCGIGLTKSHHFYDIGQGQVDEGQFDKVKEVFGPSGALAIYRKSALQDIKYENEYFDELLHHKNDVDLAYRLQWAGHKCLFFPEVKVYHDRQATNPFKSKSLLKRIFKARSNKPKWVKKDSFFGQQVVLKKNLDAKLPFSVKLKTFLLNAATIKYAIIFEPYLIKELYKVWKLRKKIADKKYHMKKVVKPSSLEKFMNKTYDR